MQTVAQKSKITQAPKKWVPALYVTDDSVKFDFAYPHKFSQFGHGAIVGFYLYMGEFYFYNSRYFDRSMPWEFRVSLLYDATGYEIKKDDKLLDLIAALKEHFGSTPLKLLNESPAFDSEKYNKRFYAYSRSI